MPAPALSFARVRAMNAEQRADYFDKFARYFEDSPKPYAIRVGSTTLSSNDTLDLREQFERLLDNKNTDSKAQAILNRLALAPVRMCRSVQQCCLCEKPITYGNDYRFAGSSCCAHVKCFAESVSHTKGTKITR